MIRSDSQHPSQQGFTLIEIALTIAVMAILAGVTTFFVTDYANAQKWEATKYKMDMIKRAIVGDDTVDAEGKRVNFGYHGDMGAVPTNLTDLSAVGAQAAWSVDGTSGMGAGWRGPYVSTQFSASYTIDEDEWGTAFVWTPGTPSLVSYGSDKVAGGTGYASDITLTFSSDLRLATVNGFVLDGDNAVKSKTVRIYYPSAGAQTSTTTTTHATNGSFSFSNIPLGVRSLAVTDTTPTLGPKLVTVNASNFLVPHDILNFSEDLQKIVRSGAQPAAGSTLSTTIDSRYHITVTLSSVTCWWSAIADSYLNAVTVGATTQTQGAGACKPNGAVLPITAAMSLAAGASGTTFSLGFTTEDCSTAKTITAGTMVTCQLNWTSATSPNPDTLTFAVQ